MKSFTLLRVEWCLKAVVWLALLQLGWTMPQLFLNLKYWTPQLQACWIWTKSNMDATGIIFIDVQKIFKFGVTHKGWCMQRWLKDLKIRWSHILVQSSSPIAYIMIWQRKTQFKVAGIFRTAFSSLIFSG